LRHRLHGLGIALMPPVKRLLVKMCDHIARALPFQSHYSTAPLRRAAASAELMLSGNSVN